MKKVLNVLIPISLMIAMCVLFAGCTGTETKTGSETDSRSETVTESVSETENNTENESDHKTESESETKFETETGGCESHSFGESVITKEPYCGNEGELIFTCSVCGKTKTEAIPPIGEHAFPEEGEIIQAATCTEKGLRRFTCTLCGDVEEEEIPVEEGHKYDEGVITKEPTCKEEGIRLHTCTLCGATREDVIEVLPIAYTVTMKGFGEFWIAENGEYKLPDPEKAGYRFIKWVDADGKDFPSEGIHKADVTVTPLFELLETKTVEELEERAAGGADVIFVTNDIIIDRTIYFTGKTNLISNKAVKLIRDVSFAGDMFVIGEASDGYSNVLKNGTAELIIGKPDGSVSITVDGNRDNMKVQVVGSALFIVNSARVAIYDGVSISNNMKAGNERNLLWEHYVGSSCTMGGAAIFITHGVFDMYGGVIDNNSVNIENIGNAEDNTNYISSYGGAIYNFGTFNMYGGTLKNNSAVRGGAIFTRKQINIFAGVIENNTAHNKGGAICTSESPYAETFIGSVGAEKDTVIFRNNVATSQGGVFLGYHYTPMMVLGGATFEGNRAEKSIGGVFATAGPITLRDSRFIDNYAFESGGVVYQYYVGEGSEPHVVTLDNCLFEGNEAGRGGVIIISAGDELKEASALRIADCEFKNNRAVSREITSVNSETGETVVKTSYGSGGAIYITKKTGMTVADTSFEGNTASVSAGAIFLTTDTQTTIKNSSFDGNISTLYGGAICASGAKTLNVTSCIFTGNGKLEDGVYSTERGGAIYNGDAQVTTVDCEFVGNVASIGGGVYVAGNGKYTDKSVASGETVLNSVFEANISNKGGAICGYGAIEINGAEFSENIAKENGGAIYGGSDAVIVANNCSFAENVVEVGSEAVDVKRFGGAVYGINASLTVKKSKFTQNGFKVAEGATGVKTYGGALAASGTATLFVSGSEFSANTSDYGGAVAAYSMNGKEFNATDITLTGNSSNNCGGAMYINNAKTVLSGLNAEKNSSRSGGALYVSQSPEVKVIGDSVFKQNTASENGGAWFVGEETVMSDKASSFEGNTAKLGGAVYINCAKETDEQTGEVTVNRGEASFKGSEFINNKANADEKDSRGGAILVSGGILSAEDVEFSGNEAIYYGGAIVGNTDSTIGLTNVSFTDNRAGNNGGAIWTYFGSETTIKGIVAKGNSSGGNGGFIYTRGGIKVLSGDKVENIFGGNGEEDLNRAVNGGVIYVLGPDGDDEYSIIELSGSDFLGNASTEGGGALYFTKSDVKINNCTFDGNNAGKYGGAIQLLTGNALIEGSELKNNTSVDNGGAIYTTQTPEDKALSTKSCVFDGNTSGKNGGAIYVTGTGVYIDGDKTVTDSGTVFKNNSAIGGGAIYVYGSAELFGSTFDSNIAAESGGAVGVNVTVLSENEETGETVYSAGKLSLSGAEFTSNVSGSHGGAVCVSGNTSFAADKCTFKKNGTTGESANGGAIYIYGTNADISNSDFDTNTSSYRGGAIYMTETPEGSAVITLNCTFSGNSATDNGGAVYLTGTSVWRDGDDLAETDKSVFSGNTAAEGGAVMTHGNVTLMGTVFMGNDSNGNGIICVGNGSLNMIGGSVTENKRGVFVKYGTFGVAGNVVIVDNTESNVYLDKKTYITVIGELDEEAKISVFAENTDVTFARPDGLTVTDASLYSDRFVSDSGMPVYGDGNGNLMAGYLILEQPGIFNGYTIKVPGEPNYAWHVYSNGAIGEALEGQTTNTLAGTLGETYVCVVTYESGEVLTSDPVTYAEKISRPICGEVCDCGEGHESVEFVPITSEAELRMAAQLGGNYYLYTDIETLNEIVVTADMTLSLNGKILKYVGENKASVIEVSEGVKFTLSDISSTERNGYIDPDTGLWTEGEYSGEGNAVTVTLKGGIITGGKASFGGAIYVLGSLKTYGGNIVNNTAGHGGAIYVATGAVADINGVTFVGNLATLQGGAIRIYETEATLSDCVFVGNRVLATEESTDNQGGALHIYRSSAIIDNCEFISNYSAYRGGAIYATQTPEGTEIVTKNCVFVGNNSVDNGGAIYLTGSAIYRDGDIDGNNGSTFEGNVAVSGGALMSHGFATLNGTAFTNNTADEGGAVYVGGKTLIDNGSSYSENSANNGGAVFVAEGATLNVKSSEYLSNVAKMGGAVYIVENAIYTDDGSKYEGNTVTSNGGAIYTNATITVKNADFANNFATTQGGAIYLYYTTAEIVGCSFNGNRALDEAAVEINTNNNGGAVYIYYSSATIDSSEFIANSVGYRGGAIYATQTPEGTEIVTKNCVFVGNTSVDNGGAIYLTGSAIYRDGDIDGNNGSTFESNVAVKGGALMSHGIATLNGTAFTNNTADEGGAVYVGGKTLIDNGSSYSENSAGLGGAVFVGENASLTVNGSVYTSNTANNGGAINNSGNVSLSDCELTGNIAKMGGAVYIVENAIYTDDGSKYDGNTVTSNGGAIYTNAAITVENAEFASNFATTQGGAIYLNHTSAEIVGCSFNGNRALDEAAVETNTTNNGGAIYVYYSSATVDSCEFISNFAGYRGGAIYMTQTPANSEVVTTNCTFTENSSVNNGGAIYLTGTAIYRDGEAGTDKGSSFSGNSTANSGGAVCGYGSASFYGSLFDGNYLTGTGNYSYMGGAVAVAGGSAVVEGASFKNNKATSSGGAIAAYGSGIKVVLTDAYFESNEASNGGAIYVGGAAEFTVTKITAKSNKAGSLGAVIYVTSANSVLTLNSATIYNNNTAKSISCGFSDIGNASAVLNIYKDNVVMLDAETDTEIDITDWSQLLKNSKSGKINELKADAEG